MVMDAKEDEKAEAERWVTRTHINFSYSVRLESSRMRCIRSFMKNSQNNQPQTYPPSKEIANMKSLMPKLS
jgi:hypothetical protein